MAIDAIIAWERQTDAGLELDLVPRDSSAGPAGQPRFTIVEPLTWRPSPGMVIWGGSGAVRIVDGAGGEHHYRRVGYTRLEEMGA